MRENTPRTCRLWLRKNGRSHRRIGCFCKKNFAFKQEIRIHGKRPGANRVIRFHIFVLALTRVSRYATRLSAACDVLR